MARNHVTSRLERPSGSGNADDSCFKGNAAGSCFKQQQGPAQAGSGNWDSRYLAGSTRPCPPVIEEPRQVDKLRPYQAILARLQLPSRLVSCLSIARHQDGAGVACAGGHAGHVSGRAGACVAVAPAQHPTLAIAGATFLRDVARHVTDYPMLAGVLRQSAAAETSINVEMQPPPGSLPHPWRAC